ncbi:MAG TPA: hypothetical protein VGC45_07595 [Gryllotalpicola sp.]
MAGSVAQPASWSWSLLQRLGVGRERRHRSQRALRPAAQAAHVEFFVSERTGDWIAVGCDCRVGYDHWHTSH